jgi:hypothetical protein
VLGVVPGVIGMLQATEAIKLILGIGDAADGPTAALRCAGACAFRETAPRPDPDCPVCPPGVIFPVTSTMRGSAQGADEQSRDGARG